MKGFLSLLGITLIVGAFGLILLSYSGNPLEELKSQERLYAYTETRQNQPEAETITFSSAPVPASTAAADQKTQFYNLDASCDKSAASTEKADSWN